MAMLFLAKSEFLTQTAPHSYQPHLPHTKCYQPHLPHTNATLPAPPVTLEMREMTRLVAAVIFPTPATRKETRWCYKFFDNIIQHRAFYFGFNISEKLCRILIS